jgi:hypothetical protein
MKHNILRAAPETMKNILKTPETVQALVSQSVVFVLGVSTGLILAMMGGNWWMVSVFLLGLGLVLGYYARRQR